MPSQRTVALPGQSGPHPGPHNNLAILSGHWQLEINPRPADLQQDGRSSYDISFGWTSAAQCTKGQEVYRMFIQTVQDDLSCGCALYSAVACTSANYSRKSGEGPHMCTSGLGSCTAGGYDGGRPSACQADVAQWLPDAQALQDCSAMKNHSPCAVHP